MSRDTGKSNLVHVIPIFSFYHGSRGKGNTRVDSAGFSFAVLVVVVVFEGILNYLFGLTYLHRLILLLLLFLANCFRICFSRYHSPMIQG